MLRSFLLIVILMTYFCDIAEARRPWFRNLFRGQSAVRSVQPAPSMQPVTHSVQPANRTMPPTTGGSTINEPTLFGMGIGVGSYPPYNYPRPGEFNPYRFDSYIYDPYQSGSFEPPDLLNDPYFRERHRYDSHFPGRRYRK